MFYSGKLKDWFIEGLVAVGPFILILVLVQLLFGWTLIVVNPAVKFFGVPSLVQNLFIAQLAGVTIFFILVILVGRLRESGVVSTPFESLINTLPALGSFYNSLTEVGNMLAGKNENYKTAVLVEYPREEVYRIGFVTDEDVSMEALGPDYYKVFIPFSPNPTNGHMAIFHEDDVINLDTEIGEALEMTISLGAAEK